MHLVHDPPDITDIRRLGLGLLTQRCAEESERFFRRQPYDPCYCSEMMRRAIVERNPRAWASVYHQYRPLVASWVRRHTDVAASGDDLDTFVNLAFTRFWQSLTPERYALSPDLKSLLRYLAMCVHSAIVDHARSRELSGLSGPASEVGLAVGDADMDLVDPAMNIEAETFQTLERAEVWRQVRARLHGEKEEIVTYYAYVVGFKPREIYAHLPGSFASVAEVHAIKEKVLVRLRRDTELKHGISKTLAGSSI